MVEVFDRAGRLCVGIDPHESLLAAWALPISAAGARDFGLRVVEATAGVAGIVKPQVAFFERFGSAGFLALEEVLAAARASGLVVIGDVKRGEIGSSMAGYAAAWLAEGSPLEVDALTLNPYLGVEDLHETFATAVRAGKGAFVLAATSNPAGTRVQSARSDDGRTLARNVLDDVAAWNATTNDVLGPIGVVIGATVDLRAAGLGDVPAPLPVLAPGFGHQGARTGEARQIYGNLFEGVIVSESRSLLLAGPDGIADAIVERAAEVRGAL
ncbi:orotidine-5'-phosphate decarboxylase [Labedella endophytica]|uniref:Orotidine-5'-phosphate decarboxylase n=1 Tax=Labedella endophytica TaxID=1523160 RepID=A0A433JUQ4_9MICO|nr:orotidine-5'-phosphate decarboxylase [Labedella endophytica]